jgi:hypothetical protein
MMMVKMTASAEPYDVELLRVVLMMRFQIRLFAAALAADRFADAT